MRFVQLVASIGTCAAGLLLALVLGVGTEIVPFGWVLAVLGALGVAAWALPQPGAADG